MPFLLLIILILLIAIGGHFLLPVLGAAVVASSALWGILLATVVIFSVGVLLFFVFSGVGVIIICIAAFVLTILGLVFFPIMFPLLIPLFIVMLVIGAVRRRQVAAQASLNQQNQNHSNQQ